MRTKIRLKIDPKQKKIISTQFVFEISKQNNDKYRIKPLYFKIRQRGSSKKKKIKQKKMKNKRYLYIFPFIPISFTL